MMKDQCGPIDQIPISRVEIFLPIGATELSSKMYRKSHNLRRNRMLWAISRLADRSDYPADSASDRAPSNDATIVRRSGTTVRLDLPFRLCVIYTVY